MRGAAKRTRAVARIRNVIEAEQRGQVVVQSESRPSFLGRLLGRSWELSLPQLTAEPPAIVLLVSLATVVGLRRWGTTEGPPPAGECG